MCNATKDVESIDYAFVPYTVVHGACIWAHVRMKDLTLRMHIRRSMTKVYDE